jgi:activator of HSP90 ATPase
VGYAKILATGNFMSACRRWNETWANFKVHFAAAHRQHKQMQGESAANSGYHAANAAVGKTEDQMEEATIDALANLATATATDRDVVAALTEANSRLAKQLEDRSNELKDIKALLKNERADRKGQRTFNPSPENYCWTHGYKVANSHTSLS